MQRPARILGLPLPAQLQFLWLLLVAAAEVQTDGIAADTLGDLAAAAEALGIKIITPLPQEAHTPL